MLYNVGEEEKHVQWRFITERLLSTYLGGFLQDSGALE